VAGFVGDSGGDRLRYTVQLIASELIKNAVVYGSQSRPVRLEIAVQQDSIELRVANGGDRIHVSDLRARRDDGGRGLEIVDALTGGWSIETGPAETVVSVRLPTGDSSADPRLPAARTGYRGGMPSRDRHARRPASSRRRS
jgi:hypothetical protein